MWTFMREYHEKCGHHTKYDTNIWWNLMWIMVHSCENIEHLVDVAANFTGKLLAGSNHRHERRRRFGPPAGKDWTRNFIRVSIPVPKTSVEHTEKIRNHSSWGLDPQIIYSKLDGKVPGLLKPDRQIWGVNVSPSMTFFGGLTLPSNRSDPNGGKLQRITWWQLNIN